MINATVYQRNATLCAPIQQFDHIGQIMVVCHSILFFLACVGNVTMLLILCNNLFRKTSSRRSSRIMILLLHMNIADLIVTFEHLPKEMIHTLMVGWYGGDVLCKVSFECYAYLSDINKLCKYMDVFGIFLSSNVLMCMCLDRFFSVYMPLSSLLGRQRVKRMVAISWIAAGVTSSPQLAIWQTATHPCVKSFSQCMSKDYLGLLDSRFVLAYTIVTAVQSYFLPLAIVVFCYSLIFCRLHSTVETQKYATVSERTNLTNEDNVGGSLRSTCQGMTPPETPPMPGTMRIAQPRASSIQLVNLQRARSKTLRMTLSIVLFFIICWTPYYVAATAHFFDIDYSTGKPRNRMQIPKIVSKLLYIFAVVNSSLNPYVYGYFSFDLRKELQDLLKLLPFPRWLRNSRRYALRQHQKQQQQQRHSVLDSSTHCTTLAERTQLLPAQ